MNADLRKLITQIEAQGLTVETARSGHLAVRDQEGHRLFTMSRSPSDHNAFNRIRQDLRRIGVDLPNRKKS